jgi:SAM-dependent methyltransferase
MLETWPQDMLERVEACPICGSSTRKRLYAHMRDRVFFCAPGEWSLYRCLGCRSAYLDPRPTPQSIGMAYQRYYTHEAAISSSPRGRLGRWRRALRNGYLNARFAYRLSPASRLGTLLIPLLPGWAAVFERTVRHLSLPTGSAKLLDVGCGNGAFLAMARELGWQVRGLEPDEASAQEAREAGLDVECASLLDAAMEERFDVITMNHVLEHLHEPEAALRKAYSLLKPGGLLWLATPNLSSSGHGVFAQDWLHLDPPRHLVLFESEALKQLLRRVGFACMPDPRPTRLADPGFRSSLAIGRGTDPMQPPDGLPLGLALRRIIADVRLAWDPLSAEELVLMARKPLGAPVRPLSPAGTAGETV